jgi:hypothetical protein
LRRANITKAEEKMIRKLAIVGLLLGFVVLAAAHDGPHQVLGKVVAIEKDSITVETAGKDAKKVTLAVTPKTKFEKSGAAATIKDLKVGDRVSIHAMEKDKKLEAQHVVFGPPPQKR